MDEPIQVRYADDPWKMLVVCQLLNLTTRKQVEPILDGLFSKYPDAWSMSGASILELQEMIKTLGLQNSRARSLVRFSAGWWSLESSDLDADKYWPFTRLTIESLHGIGPYASDSYNYFVLGNWEDQMKSRDKVVAAWRREKLRQP